MESQVRKFENERWANFDQKKEFRHMQALAMVGLGKVLDLGCGDGLFLNLLKENNLSAAGLDISEKAVEKCKFQGLSVDVFDFVFHKLPYNENSFENVVLLDVLEHVFEPDRLLLEAKRVSSRFIILSVPNFNSLPARVQVLLGRVPENNKAKKGHVFWFNMAILKQILAKNGLKIIQMKTHTFWQNKMVIGWLMKFLVKLFPSLFSLSFVVKVSKDEL